MLCPAVDDPAAFLCMTCVFVRPRKWNRASLKMADRRKEHGARRGSPATKPLSSLLRRSLGRKHARKPRADQPKWRCIDCQWRLTRLFESLDAD